MSNDPLAAQILRVVARSLDNAVKNGCAEAMSKMSVEDIAYDLAQYDVDCERVPIEQLKAGVQAWLKPQPSDATLQAQEAAQILREAEDWLQEHDESDSAFKLMAGSWPDLVRKLVALLKAAPSSGPPAPRPEGAASPWEEVEALKASFPPVPLALFVAAVDRARAAAEQQHREEIKFYTDWERESSAQMDAIATITQKTSGESVVESVERALIAVDQQHQEEMEERRTDFESFAEHHRATEAALTAARAEIAEARVTLANERNANDVLRGMQTASEREVNRLRAALASSREP